MFILYSIVIFYRLFLSFFFFFNDDRFAIFQLKKDRYTISLAISLFRLKSLRSRRRMPCRSFHALYDRVATICNWIWWIVRWTLRNRIRRTQTLLARCPIDDHLSIASSPAGDNLLNMREVMQEMSCLLDDWSRLNC